MQEKAQGNDERDIRYGKCTVVKAHRISDEIDSPGCNGIFNNPIHTQSFIKGDAAKIKCGKEKKNPCIGIETQICQMQEKKQQNRPGNQHSRKIKDINTKQKQQQEKDMVNRYSQPLAVSDHRKFLFFSVARSTAS